MHPDGRPGWILELQPLFNRHHTVEDVEQGPVLYVQVWYLNAHPDFHCSHSRHTRLSSESFMWRTELMSPCLDRLLRATPVDFHVVSGFLPDAVDTTDDLPGIHVLVAQGIVADHRVVLISVQGTANFRIPRRRFAHVLQSQLTVNESLRLAPPDDHAHSSAIVQTGGCTYLLGELINLQHGDHLVAQVSEPNVELTDDLSLQQTFVSSQPIQCKPANFNDPGDLAVSLPRQDLPPRERPDHDGEIAWILELGEQLRLHGGYSEWEDAFYMNVVTWYVHHRRYPTCNRPRRIRLYGRALPGSQTSGMLGVTV